MTSLDRSRWTGHRPATREKLIPLGGGQLPDEADVLDHLPLGVEPDGHVHPLQRPRVALRGGPYRHGGA
ncbi:hypothetical protein [Streptomyces sp. NPDC088847]|uniref:hypothetical protein n=1 Tax=Streptomyces sp. NPDC088847 TaxID=3365909 RepID=UPI003806161B